MFFSESEFANIELLSSFDQLGHNINMKARIIIDWDDEVKAYSAVCPELNYISSCGDTREEAIDNIKEAVTLMFSPLPDDIITKKDSSESIEILL